MSSQSVSSQIQSTSDQIDQLASLDCPQCMHDIDAWHLGWNEFLQYRSKIMPTFMLRASDKKLLNSGRLLVVQTLPDSSLFLVQLAMLIKVTKGVNSSISELTVLVLINEPGKPNYEYKTVGLDQVVCLLTTQVKNIPHNDVIQENESTNNFRASKSSSKMATEEAVRKFDLATPKQGTSGVPLLLHCGTSFVAHDKLGKLDMDTTNSLSRYSNYLRQVTSSSIECLKCPHFPEHFKQYEQRVTLVAQLESLKYKFSSESLELLPEYKQRIVVLQKLNFLDEHLVLLPKGLMASCISDNELMITELVLDNLLGSVEDEVVPAVLSCFVFDNKRGDDFDPSGLAEKMPEVLEVSFCS